MSHVLDDLIRFLQAAPTSWHACLEISNRLASHDFIPLSEEEPWELKNGKKYFVMRGGSICAFMIPPNAIEKSIVFASHTDSPALKIKPIPEQGKNQMVFLGTEVYGGPILHSWLNRDLGIAGKIVFTNSENAVEEKLIYIDDAPLIIPELAIHLDREKNEKGQVINKQEHLLPLAAIEKEEDRQKHYLELLLRRHVFFHELLAFDLFLVPLEPPRKLGIQGEMLASYRLDNLSSCHAALAAMIFSQKCDPDQLTMSIFCDHEEIGSNTRESATPFFMDVLKRIHVCLEYPQEKWFSIKKQSLVVSVDVAHAFNPLYKDKYEPNHQPLLGNGIVVKYNANQKYASQSSASAYIIHLCKKHQIPYQHYVNRSDIAGGSTLGPQIAQATGIKTVDIGIGVFSMHSAREIIGCQDHLDMCQLLTHIAQEGAHEYASF